MLSLDSICERLSIPLAEDVDEVLMTLKGIARDYWVNGLFNRDFLLSAFDPALLLRHGIFCDPPLSRRVLDGLPDDCRYSLNGNLPEIFVLGGYVVQDINAVGHYFTHASAEIRKGKGAFYGAAAGVVVSDASGYGYDKSRVDGRDQAAVFLDDYASGVFSGTAKAFCSGHATGLGLDSTNMVGSDDCRLILRDGASAICQGSCFFEAFQEACVVAQDGAFGIIFGPKVNLMDKVPHWVVAVEKAPLCHSQPLDCPVVDWCWEPLQDLSKLRKQYTDNQQLLRFLQEVLPQK